MEYLKLVVLILISTNLSYGNYVQDSIKGGGTITTDIDLKNQVVLLVDTEDEQVNVLKIYLRDQLNNQVVLDGCFSPKCSISLSDKLTKGIYEIEVHTNTGRTFTQQVTID